MMYPKEYIDFLVHFHGDRDYFECHEILEEYWKEVDSKNKNSVWVGLIQLAVALYHHRRGNFNGAVRTIQKSLHIFSLNTAQLEKLGIDYTLLLKQMNEMFAKMNNGQDYESLNIPIVSKALVELCLHRCRQQNVEWCSHSDLNNTELVHRHKQRDRTQVINERNKALQKKIEGSDC